MKAVIFAAGQSTRTYPLTLTRPKPLLPVGNKPILEWHLEALSGLVDQVMIVVGYRAEMIQERFGASFGDVAIEYVHQTEQRGTGHALLTCADRLDAPFIAMNGDDILDAVDMKRLAAVESGALASPVTEPSRYGIFGFDADGTVNEIAEKAESPPSDLANVGVYKFTPDVLDILRDTEPSPRGEIEITCGVQALIEQGRFEVVKCDGAWIPVGYPWDLITANAHVLNTRFDPSIEGEVSPLAELTGPVSVGVGSVVRAGVVIEGPVCIGEGCTVGPNAWLRPGTSLGDGCKVGHAVEIKNSVLLPGAKVPHLSYMGDSVIGANANVGCGTITANFRHDGGNHRSMDKGELVDTELRKLGAIIGDDVHTGINTSIYPGRKLWPHTSTLPGEVVDRDKVE